MLNNREIAVLLWLGVATLWLLFQPKQRSGLCGILKLFLQPVIIIPLLAMFAWIGLELWVGAHLSLWNAAFAKDTVPWTVGSAAVLFFNCTQAATDPRFFRRTMLDTVGVVVFVGFFINLYVMSLPVELALQPVVLILTLCATVGSFKPEHRRSKISCEALLTVVGCALLIYTARRVYLGWGQIDARALLLKFGLPVWLTIGLLPFIYGISLYLSYDSAFRRINSFNEDGRARWRARAALLISFHVRIRDLSRFHAYRVRELSAASTFTVARQIIGNFKRQQREAARAVADEQERLRRYAGSDDTDERGRRLDRREFKETIDALSKLHMYQMGCYGNLGGRYRDDLLQIIGKDLTRSGLPEESGITLRVSEDGQSWYAWRRTVTGWCFAIGAAGPPPNQWEFDGLEPPTTCPGQDPAWGKKPFSNDTNLNWR